MMALAAWCFKVWRPVPVQVYPTNVRECVALESFIEEPGHEAEHC